MTRPPPLAPGRPRPLPRRAALAPLAAAVFLLLWPAPSAAQSKSDAFAGKIPPVSAALYRKAGRFEASLSANFSLNDPFYTKYFAGLKLDYHFTETLSAGALFATGMNVQAGSAQVCPSNGGCHPASPSQMYQVPGKIRMITGLEGAWAPVYGKLNVFSEGAAHFDLALIGGVDLISYQKVVSSSDAQALEESGEHPPNANTPGAHLGLGLRLFYSEWGAVRLDLRDYVYRVSVPNWQVNGGAKQDVQTQLFAELGVSFFFPTHNRPVQ